MHIPGPNFQKAASVWHLAIRDKVLHNSQIAFLWLGKAAAPSFCRLARVFVHTRVWTHCVVEGLKDLGNIFWFLKFSAAFLVISVEKAKEREGFELKKRAFGVSTTLLCENIGEASFLFQWRMKWILKPPRLSWNRIAVLCLALATVLWGKFLFTSWYLGTGFYLETQNFIYFTSLQPIPVAEVITNLINFDPF